MSDSSQPPNSASGANTSGDRNEITAALADAGAEIIRAIVVAADRGSRRRHIVNARRLLSIAYDGGTDEQD